MSESECQGHRINVRAKSCGRVESWLEPAGRFDVLFWRAQWRVVALYWANASSLNNTADCVCLRIAAGSDVDASKPHIHSDIQYTSHASEFGREFERLFGGNLNNLAEAQRP